MTSEGEGVIEPFRERKWGRGGEEGPGWGGMDLSRRRSSQRRRKARTELVGPMDRAPQSGKFSQSFIYHFSSGSH